MASFRLSPSMCIYTSSVYPFFLIAFFFQIKILSNHEFQQQFRRSDVQETRWRWRCYLMQRSIIANCVPRFRNRFSYDYVDTLSYLDVTQSNPEDVWCPSLHTKELLSESPVRPISTELFRFQPHDQLLALAKTNKQLPGNVSESLLS